jgi:hypothetical protein
MEKVIFNQTDYLLLIPAAKNPFHRGALLYLSFVIYEPTFLKYGIIVGIRVAPGSHALSVN